MTWRHIPKCQHEKRQYMLSLHFGLKTTTKFEKSFRSCSVINRHFCGHFTHKLCLFGQAVPTYYAKVVRFRRKKIVNYWPLQFAKLWNDQLNPQKMRRQPHNYFAKIRTYPTCFEVNSFASFAICNRYTSLLLAENYCLWFCWQVFQISCQWKYFTHLSNVWLKTFDSLSSSSLMHPENWVHILHCQKGEFVIN